MLNKHYNITYTSGQENYFTTPETKEEADQVKEELGFDGFSDITVEEVRG